MKMVGRYRINEKRDIFKDSKEKVIGYDVECFRRDEEWLIIFFFISTMFLFGVFLTSYSFFYYDLLTFLVSLIVFSVVGFSLIPLGKNIKEDWIFERSFQNLEEAREYINELNPKRISRVLS